MTKSEVFEEISAMPEFKKYNKAYRVMRQLHKQGKLGPEAYEKLFRHFGYIKTIETWERQRYPNFNFKDIETPKSGVEIYTNYYWVCENGDTKRALFFGDYPQCNSNKNIVQLSLREAMYNNMNLKVVFVPVGYVSVKS